MLGPSTSAYGNPPVINPLRRHWPENNKSFSGQGLLFKTHTPLSVAGTPSFIFSTRIPVFFIFFSSLPACWLELSYGAGRCISIS
jgi:hypothetical protein